MSDPSPPPPPAATPAMRRGVHRWAFNATKWIPTEEVGHLCNLSAPAFTSSSNHVSCFSPAYRFPILLPGLLFSRCVYGVDRRQQAAGPPHLYAGCAELHPASFLGSITLTTCYCCCRCW